MLTDAQLDRIRQQLNWGNGLRKREAAALMAEVDHLRKKVSGYEGFHIIAQVEDEVPQFIAGRKPNGW